MYSSLSLLPSRRLGAQHQDWKSWFRESFSRNKRREMDRSRETESDQLSTPVSAIKTSFFHFRDDESK